ncbi:MAG: Asp-tRNA(Asn)/Glu-tRNA(Gln) amidotransferase subunit GatA [Planctomycetes bacterium]|nr:Asp-tRNA(Asn)/Glu-tRNA(Gln) amidotransferase subunit GatA [Planctomycetota bacterium]
MSGEFTDAVSIRDAVRSGKTSAEQVAKDFLRRAATSNKALNAFHEVFESEAIEAARAIDAKVKSGNDPGPLAGVPVAVKDNLATKVGKTTCSSRMLENYRSPFTATCVERLQAAGAIVMGKTNMDEFAMGSSTEHCAWGAVKNPWDTLRVPGGSSGGSAVAAAAGLCGFSLGSDTGGSIRQPASLCGCVGFKPTYGRISRYGLVAFGSSLDQVGPLTRSVRDAALAYQVMSGLDHRDSTSADFAVEDPMKELEVPLAGLRVGVPKQYLSDANDPAVNDCVNDALQRLKGQGVTLVEVDLPLTDIGISTYYVIAPAEASGNLARFDGIRYGHRAALKPGESLDTLYARSRAEGFGPEVQRRIMLGTYVLSSGYYDAYYGRALRIRRLIKGEFDRAFQKCDVIAGPASPSPAFAFGGMSDPLKMYLCDVYTVNTNIAGLPALSVPIGFVKEGAKSLPVGFHLQAPAFAESKLLRAARMVEKLYPDLPRQAPDFS